MCRPAPVDRYVTPEDFRRFYEVGMELGFRHVESGPLVRSSDHAWEQDEGYRTAVGSR